MALHNLINTQLVVHPTVHPTTKVAKRKASLIFETPAMNKETTKPWLKTHRIGAPQWVYNALNHMHDENKIQYEDPDETNGFVLVPCANWDMKRVEDLCMMAFVQRTDLECLRDLNGDHLPLLKNILEKGMETITSTYDVKSSQIRAYIHYLPSYEHFYVNFSHLMYNSGGVEAEKAHLLHNVIYNIENISSKFYENRTLPLKLYEDDPLLELLLESE